jgi:hypothetical protein
MSFDQEVENKVANIFQQLLFSLPQEEQNNVTVIDSQRIHMFDFMKALDFAAFHHRNQRRSDRENTPYINHPIHLALLLSKTNITHPDIIIASLLHDLIEDTNVSEQDIKTKFGKNVASIVMECTDDKKLDKMNRKHYQFEHAPFLSSKAKFVKLADKCANVIGLLSDPPVSWSADEILGCATWSYAVCLNLVGVDSSVNATTYKHALRDFFAFLNPRFEHISLDKDALKPYLLAYYNIIDQSE